jgi:hypothetical protein
LPAWKKWALAIGATPSSFLIDVLDYFEPMADISQPNPGEWRHASIVWTNAVTNLVADEEIVGFDISNITNGGLDSSWTSADYDTVDAVLKLLVQQWSLHQHQGMSSKEIRYYRRSFNPYTNNTQPFPPTGPPERVTPWVVAGQDPTPIANQIAVTHSEITAYPRHWGRAYWPAPGAGVFATGGYLSTTFVDAWATVVHDAYQSLQDAQFFPTVVTTQVNKLPSRQLLGVSAIQVDNVPDVIRRRRPRTTTHRKALPISP